MQLHRAQPDVAAAGSGVVLVGMGSPRQASWFRRRFAPSLRVLADEDRASYGAAGLKGGSVGALFGPASLVGGVRHAARSGVVQGRPVGNVAQLGGAVVVAPGGELLLHRRAENASDSVAPEALIAALRRAA